MVDRIPGGRPLLVAALAACAWPSGGLTAQPYLWQTNSGGDDVHVIDLSRSAVVDRVVVGPEPHGLAAPDDEGTVVISLEANDRDRGELVWIDPERRRVIHRVEVGPEPHEIAVTPDGRWIYVPCRDGHYWVVDGDSREVVERIRTGGRPHNVRAGPRSRRMYLSPMGGTHELFIVDVLSGHEVVGRIRFGGSLRPPAISPRHGLFFQHVDGLNGFEVADLGEGRVIARIEHRTDLGWFLLPIRKLGWFSSEGLKRCHGLEVTPDEREIWSVCGDRVNVHEIAGRAFPEVASVPLPGKGYWITFSPDGRQAFVALSGRNAVAVVDAETKTVVTEVPVGLDPKRNLVLSRGGG
ncbi:MAG: hypothetical protein GWM92_02955 [Gemmatimonadetes bacterium]|nr:hypothetical protein [Gemmatimonadota bacterium]NIR77457.1 hypothetical protein [Gemmatimonadota bacterium]NIT85981.1 hypothetical protein [Gemmatimonadota bacterium]NIU29801.1 hypothetical protein [Gemmatimonadota bacterium]NIU34823.1 hypothetical protein [Gemmatimonadota bacterium]